MPGLGGVELAERLREALPDLPVLFTSGYAGAECEVPAGSPFIGRPFLPEALARAVRDALDGERAA
jgi:CheY-like chemotaxis protein